MGPNIGNSSTKTVIDANVLCNEFGIDPNNLGFTLSFAQECVEKGILEVDDLNLTFTDDADVLKLTEMIAYRNGIGDLLAEGSTRAAKSIGKDAEKYALAVKNNEVVPFEPRTQTNLALGYATASVGPRYDICEHDWDFDTRVGWETSSHEVLRIGELRYHLYRIYNNREGVDYTQDTLPDRFFDEAIDFGMHEGVKLDREKFQESIDLYYAMMGWDSEGRPTEAVLYDFGLEWLLEED